MGTDMITETFKIDILPVSMGQLQTLYESFYSSFAFLISEIQINPKSNNVKNFLMVFPEKECNREQIKRNNYC